MGLSNFERKKAGKLELESWVVSNFRSWKAGDAPENLIFWEIYDIIKVAYYRASARVIPKS